MKRNWKWVLGWIAVGVVVGTAVAAWLLFFGMSVVICLLGEPRRRSAEA
ncbi:MAG TPA: hypothetical protein VLH75_07715 [Longimicrobiales bacterium]|nr:hypothetical protein [Longimicrobiales bacterium]